MPGARFLAFWLFMAACGQPHRAAPPSHDISGVQPVTTPNDSTIQKRLRSLNIYEPGKLTYEYRANAVIQSIAGDSIPRSDSMRIQARVIATFTSDTGTIREAEILIDSAQVTTITTNTTNSTAQFFSYPPQEYAAKIDSRTGKIVSDDRGHVETCSGETVTPLLVGEEVLPVIPSLALTTHVWADTSQYRICRAGVLLFVKRVTRYHTEDLLGHFSGPAAEGLSIVRTSEITLNGEGLQWQQIVQASGIGTSTDTLTFHLNPARLESLSGHSRIELGFRSDLRTQRFLQLTETRINNRAGLR